MGERGEIYWQRKGLKIAVFHLLLAPTVGSLLVDVGHPCNIVIVFLMKRLL